MKINSKIVLLTSSLILINFGQGISSDIKEVRSLLNLSHSKIKEMLQEGKITPAEIDELPDNLWAQFPISVKIINENLPVQSGSDEKIIIFKNEEKIIAKISYSFLAKGGTKNATVPFGAFNDNLKIQMGFHNPTILTDPTLKNYDGSPKTQEEREEMYNHMMSMYVTDCKIELEKIKKSSLIQKGIKIIIKEISTPVDGVNVITRTNSCEVRLDEN